MARPRPLDAERVAQRHHCWRFCLQWVLITALGTVLWLALYRETSPLLLGIVPVELHQEAAFTLWIAGSALVGATQYVLLRRKTLQAGWWVPATAVGVAVPAVGLYLLTAGDFFKYDFAVYQGLSKLLGFDPVPEGLFSHYVTRPWPWDATYRLVSLAMVISRCLFGMVIGSCVSSVQSLVLRRLSGRWIKASVMGWGMFLALVTALIQAGRMLPWAQDPRVSVYSVVISTSMYIGHALGGAGLGAVTAVTLARLLRTHGVPRAG